MRMFRKLGYGLSILLWTINSNALWAAETARPTSMLILSEGAVEVKNLLATPSSPRPLDKWPAGIDINLSPQASVRLVYLNSGTLETWQGPAHFTTGENQSIPHQGEPEIRQVPSGAMVHFGRLNPDILATNIQRGGLTMAKSADFLLPKAISKEALETYATMKEQLPQSLAPELYWLSVLHEAGETERFRAHLQRTLQAYPQWAQQLRALKLK